MRLVLLLLSLGILVACGPAVPAGHPPRLPPRSTW